MEQGRAPAAAKRRDDDAENSTRFGQVGGVGADLGMSGIEPAGQRVDEVAAFGDGQRDDANFRPNEHVQNRLRRRLGEFDHRAGHGRGVAGGIELDDGRQPVLRSQARAHGGVEGFDAGPDDRPVMVAAEIEQPM